jgi:hypothetical protein
VVLFHRDANELFPPQRLKGLIANSHKILVRIASQFQILGSLWCRWMKMDVKKEVRMSTGFIWLMRQFDGGFM